MNTVATKRRPRLTGHQAARRLKLKEVLFREPARVFGPVLRIAEDDGACLISGRPGMPLLIAVGLENPKLILALQTCLLVDAARRRNPKGVFTLADDVFGSDEKADAWMARELPALAFKRPIACLNTTAGTQKIIDLLISIQHGVFA